jgi:hypothetical protein
VLARRLIESHEHVKRFPVLYYFESGDEGESMATLLKSAASTCLALRDAGDERRAAPLERALGRLFDDLERDFIGGRGRATRPAVAAAGYDRGRFTARADRVIGAFAEDHRQVYDGLR